MQQRKSTFEMYWIIILLLICLPTYYNILYILSLFAFLYRFYLNTASRMKASNYQCVNCQILFQVEAQYIEHYKSEHHRYNVKRKIIGLPPLSSQEYHLQFQDEKTSKQSVDQQFYCEICSKKFMNSGTYKQHISSKKHKLNRAQLKVPQKFTMSKSSSESEFQIIGTQKPETCFFCNSEGSSHHMKIQHSFPPFEAECINYNGLVEHVRTKVAKLCCVYCDMKFNSEESVKQHMNDVGHAKLNIERFNEYEKFYLWKILQSSSESDQQVLQQKTLSPPKQQQSQSFINLQPPTLQQLQQRRLDRITYTPTGAIINGKQVGYRHLRVYYKQYLNREIINLHPKNQVAIEGQIKHDWKSGAKAIQKVPKINATSNCR